MADQNFKEKKRILLVFFITVIIFGIYEFFQKKDIQKRGVYTKATVIKSEGYKGGIMITVDYKYQGKQYEGIVVASLGKSAIGRQYFIQFFPADPKAIVFNKEEPVPDCLTNIDAPDSGWNKIPACP